MRRAPLCRPQSLPDRSTLQCTRRCRQSCPTGFGTSLRGTPGALLPRSTSLGDSALGLCTWSSVWPGQTVSHRSSREQSPGLLTPCLLGTGALPRSPATLCPQSLVGSGSLQGRRLSTSCGLGSGLRSALPGTLQSFRLSCPGPHSSIPPGRLCSICQSPWWALPHRRASRPHRVLPRMTQHLQLLPARPCMIP